MLVNLKGLKVITCLKNIEKFANVCMTECLHRLMP